MIAAPLTTIPPIPGPEVDVKPVPGIRYDEARREEPNG